MGSWTRLIWWEYGEVLMGVVWLGFFVVLTLFLLRKLK